MKGSGGKDTLLYSPDDKQKGHMGTPVKNILITLLINTSSNLKEKVTRIKEKLSVPRSMPSLFRLIVLELFKHVFEYLMTISPPPIPPRAIPGNLTLYLP